MRKCVVKNSIYIGYKTEFSDSDFCFIHSLKKYILQEQDRKDDANGSMIGMATH